MSTDVPVIVVGEVPVGVETSTNVAVYVPVAGAVPVTVSIPYPPDGARLADVPVNVDAGCVEPASEPKSRSVRAPQAERARIGARRKATRTVG